MRERTGLVDLHFGSTQAEAEGTDRFTLFAGEVLQESEVLQPASLWVRSAGAAVTMELVEGI
jgi:hypothetical protein